MKKLLITLGLAAPLFVSSICADSLKNSLNNMLGNKDTSGMVNLNNVSVGAKPRPKQVVKNVRKKSRPGSAVIGRYNDGKAVRKKEADKYIRKATKGKIKDLDLLPKKQRLMVLKDLKRLYAEKHFKSRPASAVVATVNGVSIHKKEVDKYLKSVTGGKVKDFDRLDKKQRLTLVEDLARPIVLQNAVENNVSEAEKEAIFKQMWLEKQRASIEVTGEEMLALYEIKKEKTLARNPQAQIPPYMSLGDNLKNEILEKKMMINLLKDVNITVNYDTNETMETNNSNESSEKLDKIPDTKETE